MLDLKPVILLGYTGVGRSKRGCGTVRKEKERKSIYIALFGQGGTLKVLRHGSHSFTCK